MKRFYKTAGLMLVCASLIADVRADDDGAKQDESTKAPHWIWCQERRLPDTAGFFRKSFSVEKNVTAATLRAVGESANLAIYWNGNLVAKIDHYDPLLELDVTERARRGKQLLAIKSVSCPGPSALFLRLDLKFDDGSRQSIVTDAT